MFKIIKRIFAPISAALILGIIISGTPSSKAAATQPEMYSIIECTTPTEQSNALTEPMPVHIICGKPHAVNLPCTYPYNYIICNTVRCFITWFNNQFWYQMLDDNLYPVYYY